ncbi:hypothetical protein PAEPH01_1938 [Pancytospora epiphaga]|nr:hypothetical protein PAEPH01_1938 [Pancytospora epiphaga]
MILNMLTSIFGCILFGVLAIENSRCTREGASQEHPETNKDSTEAVLTSAGSNHSLNNSTDGSLDENGSTDFFHKSLADISTFDEHHPPKKPKSFSDSKSLSTSTERRMHSARSVSLTTQNGIKVNAVTIKSSSKEVNISFHVGVGFLNIPDTAHPLMPYLVLNVVLRELEEYYDSNALDVCITKDVSSDYSSVKIRTTVECVEMVFKLLSNGLRRGLFREAAVESPSNENDSSGSAKDGPSRRSKKESSKGVRTNKNTLMEKSLAIKTGNSILWNQNSKIFTNCGTGVYDYTGVNPLGFFDSTYMKEFNRECTSENINKFVLEYYRPETIRILVIGNLMVEELVKCLNLTIGDVAMVGPNTPPRLVIPEPVVDHCNMLIKRRPNVVFSGGVFVPILTINFPMFVVSTFLELEVYKMAFTNLLLEDGVNLRNILLKEEYAYKYTHEWIEHSAGNFFLKVILNLTDKGMDRIDEIPRILRLCYRTCRDTLGKQIVQSLQRSVLLKIEEMYATFTSKDIIARSLMVYGHFDIDSHVLGIETNKATEKSVKGILTERFVRKKMLENENIAYFYDSLVGETNSNKPVPPAVVVKFNAAKTEDEEITQKLKKEYFKLHLIGKNNQSLSWHQKNTYKKYKRGILNSVNYWKKFSEFQKNISVAAKKLAGSHRRQSKDISKYLIEGNNTKNSFILKDGQTQCECYFDYSLKIVSLSIICCLWSQNVTPVDYVYKKALLGILLERFIRKYSLVLKFLEVKVDYENQLGSFSPITVSGRGSAVLFIARLFLKSSRKVVNVEVEEVNRVANLLIDQLRLVFEGDMAKAVELVGAEFLFNGSIPDKVLLEGISGLDSIDAFPTLKGDSFIVKSVNIHDVEQVVDIYKTGMEFFIKAEPAGKKKKLVKRPMSAINLNPGPKKLEGFMGNRFLNSVSVFINLGIPQDTFLHSLFCRITRIFFMKLINNEESQISGDLVQRKVHGNKEALIIYAYGKLGVSGIQFILSEFLKQVDDLIDKASLQFILETYLLLGGPKSTPTASDVPFEHTIKDRLKGLAQQLTNPEETVSIVSRKKKVGIITLEKVE